jgi:hypothetical protein
LTGVACWRFLQAMTDESTTEDRLMSLLEQATRCAEKGDLSAALLLFQEAHDTALKLPKKNPALPNLREP